MASGIKNKVVILGMGCTGFGERWDMSSDMLMVEAFTEALADAGIEKSRIEAAWFGSALDDVNVGNSAIPLATALRLRDVPVTRVENMCATGTEALRGAVYAVAAGAVDVALALGVEKLKDTGFGGLPIRTKGSVNDLWMPYGSAPGTFAQLAGAYQAKHGIKAEDLKRGMAHVSWKSHQNGTLSPKAHLRKAVDMETIINAPMIADPLGLYDCCGVSDGAACAIVTTPEVARSLGKSSDDLVAVKALQVCTSNGWESQYGEWDGASVRNTQIAASRAYEEAGIRDPRADIGVAEVHDCFSITELVTMEDLGLSDEGRAAFDYLDGRYDRDGAIPAQVDGGLKCFGHPVGASGLRMAYEVHAQLLGRAGQRQLRDVNYGLTHNLGGQPSNSVSSVSIFGRLQGGLSMAGRYYEGFEIGEVISHDTRRTVTETDNVLFSTLTMNPAAIHLDYDYCETTEFGKPLVNSIFTLGLVVGLSVGDTTLGTTVGNLGWEDVKFPKPVFIGDTIRAETEVADKRESKSRPTQGIVTFIHRGINQRDEIVCQCRRLALMMKQPA